MQSVIELGRMSRERRAIGLKTPLKSLVVIHPDQTYLDDVRALERYVIEEMNIRDLVLSSDEDRYGVKYVVSADWPTLGKKLKKDVQRVKKALPHLTSDQVRKFMSEGHMTVDGIELVREDLIVKRSVDATKSAEHLETNSNDDVLIILDAAIYPELAIEGLTREVINRVQKLRKTAGLVPTDDVKMEYRMLSDPDKTGLGNVFQSETQTIQKVLRRPIDKHQAVQVEAVAADPDASEKTDGNGSGNLIIEEEQEVQNARFLLRLLRL